MLKNSTTYIRRTLAVGALAALTFGGIQATAAPVEADAAAKGVKNTTKARALTEMKSVTITRNGTVLDAARVKGNIAVKADNVTIKNSVVDYGGYHSIRIYPGAEGTKILDTTINCQKSKTNGIVFSNYVAKRVSANGCRTAFMSNDTTPAKVVDSFVNGKAFSLNAGSTTPTPTPTETPVPTPTPTETPVPTVPVTPSTGRADASNTGVPAGTRLTASAGMTITQPGTVIDGRHITGTVTIAANNVTIRNSLIETSTSMYPIRVQSGANGFVIEDVEIDNMGGTGIGIFISGSNGTVRRANIHSAEDGIRIQGDAVTVENSYIHDLQRQAGGHHDTIQIRSGDDITLVGNTLLPFNASTNDPMNAALQIGSLSGTDQISNLRVMNNYMNGGNFTINGGGRNEVDSAVYSGNRFGRDYRYDVRGNLDNSVWEASNVWDDSGLAIR